MFFKLWILELTYLRDSPKGVKPDPRGVSGYEIARLEVSAVTLKFSGSRNPRLQSRKLLSGTRSREIKMADAKKKTYRPISAPRQDRRTVSSAKTRFQIQGTQ